MHLLYKRNFKIFICLVFLLCIKQNSYAQKSSLRDSNPQDFVLNSPGFAPNLDLFLRTPSLPNNAQASTKISKVDQNTINKLYSINRLIKNQTNVLIGDIPPSNSQIAGRVVGVHASDEIVLFSLNPKLQELTDSLIKKSTSPHVAIVVMDPYTGKILALSQKSKVFGNFALHSGLPAASLFKLVTTAAALESAKVEPEQKIRYRGGNYTLERWNYLPDSRRDRSSMSITEALGKSCNAVFGRISLNYLNANVLEQFAQDFGFNSKLNFDMPLGISRAKIPDSDYELSRTAAGFGDVKLTAIHAAALMAGIANGGALPRPSIIDRIVRTDGTTIYQNKPEIITRMMKPKTALTLLEMMTSTTTVGTSRKEFFFKHRQTLPGVRVAAKTGTLNGDNPKGTNRWFVAAAPIEDPKIAIAAIVVDERRPYYTPAKIGMEIIKFMLKN